MLYLPALSRIKYETTAKKIFAGPGTKLVDHNTLSWEEGSAKRPKAIIIDKVNLRDKRVIKYLAINKEKPNEKIKETNLEIAKSEMFFIK